MARHGYHGPFEGELSGVSWREDRAPLLKMLDGYRAMGEDAGPAAMEAGRAADRRQAETQLLAALPRAGQVQARLVLKLAGKYLPLRGVGKVAFLQSLDVARAAARRIGVLLADGGVIAEPEDVFYLTAAEVLGSPPADAKDLVTERREIRESYRKLRLPTFWTGEPVYEVIADVEDSAEGAAGRLGGVGVSSGIVEGPARVVTDPALADMDPGDILIAHTTDPSWASLMFMASALVVDIGGQLSHAAVVARELGIPCVMNTLDGTRLLHDGDRLRVDGGAGTVEILKRLTPGAEQDPDWRGSRRLWVPGDVAERTAQHADPDDDRRQRWHDQPKKSSGGSSPAGCQRVATLAVERAAHQTEQHGDRSQRQSLPDDAATKLWASTLSTSPRTIIRPRRPATGAHHAGWPRIATERALERKGGEQAAFGGQHDDDRESHYGDSTIVDDGDDGSARTTRRVRRRALRTSDGSGSSILRWARCV